MYAQCNNPGIFAQFCLILKNASLNRQYIDIKRVYFFSTTFV